MAKRTPSSAGASYGQWDAVNRINNVSDAWSRYKATQIITPGAKAKQFFTMAYKRAQTRYAPNTKLRRTTRTKTNSTTLLPAKVRVNPKTGKVQVFVSPAVAAKVKGKRNPEFWDSPYAPIEEGKFYTVHEITYTGNGTKAKIVGKGLTYTQADVKAKRLKKLHPDRSYRLEAKY